MLRDFNLIKQMSESKTVIGLNMLRLWDDRGTLEPWIGPMSTALSDGTAAPMVHKALRRCTGGASYSRREREHRQGRARALS